MKILFIGEQALSVWRFPEGFWSRAMNCTLINRGNRNAGLAARL